MRDISWLKGSITPIVTPFRNQAVDYETEAKKWDEQSKKSRDNYNKLKKMNE